MDNTVRADIPRKPCPYCREMIAESAARCRFCGSDLIGRPASATRAPVGGSVLLVGGGVFIAIVLLGFVAAHRERKPVMSIPVASLSAAVLFGEYHANELAADAKYKGRPIEVTGVVKSIGSDILGTPYIALDAGDRTAFSVQCMFDDNDGLVILNQGDRVRIRGTCNGKMLNVVLDDCILVP